MNVLNTLSDMIKGNPFETPIGQMIMAYTSRNTEFEDWGEVMNICDVINNTKLGPNQAVRALIRRINETATTDVTAALCSLSLLDSCVKNCGYRFHILLAEADNMQCFSKLVMAQKNEVSLVVQYRILNLIEFWYRAFANQVDLMQFSDTYTELVRANVKFPPNDALNSPSLHRAEAPVNTKLSTSTSSATSFEELNQPNVTTTKLTFDQMLQKLEKECTEAEASMELLNQMNQSHSQASPCPDLQSLTSEDRALMQGLYNGICKLQNNLMVSISSLQAYAESMQQQNGATATNIGPDGSLDDKLQRVEQHIMQLLELNSNLCHTKNNHERLWFSQQQQQQQQPQQQPLQSAASSTESNAKVVPGLKDTVSELEEMEAWMKSNNEPKPPQPGDASLSDMNQSHDAHEH